MQAYRPLIANTVQEHEIVENAALFNNSRDLVSRVINNEDGIDRNWAESFPGRRKEATFITGQLMPKALNLSVGMVIVGDGQVIEKRNPVAPRVVTTDGHELTLCMGPKWPYPAKKTTLKKNKLYLITGMVLTSDELRLHQLTEGSTFLPCKWSAPPLPLLKRSPLLEM